MNQAWLGAMNATLKWLYLIVFALAADLAMQRCGRERTLRALSVVFVVPILLQWLSVPWGLKATNEDGSTSFLGGYQHQQSLSIILLTFLYVTCFSRRTSSRRCLSTAGGFGGWHCSAQIIERPCSRQRCLPPPRILHAAPEHRAKASWYCVCNPGDRDRVCLFSGSQSSYRIGSPNIGTMIDKNTSLLQPPERFSQEETRMFSGRAYLWSQYIDAYLDGSIINILVGFGPEGWVGRFSLYAQYLCFCICTSLGYLELPRFYGFWFLILSWRFMQAAMKSPSSSRATSAFSS